MDIELYLANHKGKPFPEIMPEDQTFVLSWKGTTADLEIYRILDDEQLLEAIFDAFSIDRRPKNYGHERRSLSIGDVVVLDYRPYQCQSTGWNRLDKFDLQTDGQ